MYNCIKKNLWINLTKKMKDLHTENYKTLIKEIEEDTNKWKDILCSWIGRINIFHTTQSNLQIRCNPYQNSNGIFHRYSTNNLKFHTEPQNISNNQSKHSWRHYTSWFQTILQIYSNQIVLYWDKNRHVDQWDRNKPMHIQSINLYHSS